MDKIFSFLFVSLALVIVAAKSFSVVKEDERLVVIRLGKLIGVCGPGLNMIVPFIDRAIRVKVETIAGWRGLSERELQNKAAQIALKDDK